jgi:uncharacterized protein YjbJ (UPF0337 family)
VTHVRQAASAYFLFVTAQTGGNIKFNLNASQDQPVNFNIRSLIMNKNQVEGVLKEVTGKVQEELGKLGGSKEQQVKGIGKQISGKAEKIYGDAKEVVKNSSTHS